MHQRNFLSLLLCLSLGTASLPHILTRYNTTTSVASARRSVGWTLFFVALFYLTVPVLAVLIKYEILTGLVGHRFADLPQWVMQWRKVEPYLIRISDVNGDGIVRWAGIQMQPDMVVLAAPEIAGLPYVISGLIAAGALAAALSTADGLLLTIANALSHDVYYCMVDKTRDEPAARDDIEDLAARRRAVRVVCGVAEYGEHSVSGGRGVFAGGVEPVSGARAGRVLEAHDEARRRGGDDGGACRVRLLHRVDVSVLHGS